MTMINLYVKEHNITKKRYFGKTTKDPFKYKGSGKHWKRHIKKHGYNVSTWLVGSFSVTEDATAAAIKFSRENNIVNSDNWLNLIEENALDGVPVGYKMPKNRRQKISNALRGKPSPKSKYVVKEAPEVRSNRYKKINSGRVWVNNGLECKRISPGQPIPKGYVKGRLGKLGDKSLGKRNTGSNTRGKVIYNNKKINRYFFEGKQPEGFDRGRLKRK